jgi:hypothetical protein
VFAAKDEMVAGVGTTDHDFGDTGAQPCVINFDVDELADTSFHVDVYTRETETDGWWHIGGSGANAVNLENSTFSFERYRYVRVIITVTGSDLPAGVTGY